MRNEKKIYEETELSKIKVPPKMFKRMKPKDAELTVIGLPSSKVSKINNFKPSITSFFKLKGIEKDRFILECLVPPLVARNALKVVLIGAEEIKININEISDLIRDDSYDDFNCMEKYFEEETWLECLKVEKKKKMKIDLPYFLKNTSKEYRFTCLVKGV